MEAPQDVQEVLDQIDAYFCISDQSPRLWYVGKVENPEAMTHEQEVEALSPHLQPDELFDWIRQNLAPQTSAA